jgi:hypothetical protein
MKPTERNKSVFVMIANVAKKKLNGAETMNGARKLSDLRGLRQSALLESGLSRTKLTDAASNSVQRMKLVGVRRSGWLGPKLSSVRLSFNGDLRLRLSRRRAAVSSKTKHVTMLVLKANGKKP